MAYIAIDWLHGRPHKGAEDDEARAAAAAEAVLNAAGADYNEAEAEYRRQWVKFDDEDLMTGLTLVWIEANKAADIALTEGWHKPEAHCSIRASWAPR